MEKPHYLTGAQLEPAPIRLGAVLRKTLPILTTAYENDEWLLVGDIERRLPIVTAGVRRAVHKLDELYIPKNSDEEEDKFIELLISDYHPTATWKKDTGVELPSTVYSLTRQGYSWARFTINCIVLAGNRKLDNKLITKDLRKVKK